MSLIEWGPVDHYMQSVCDNMAINYDKPVKIANLLSSSSTDIHINSIHSEFSQKPKDLKQKSFI